MSIIYGEVSMKKNKRKLLLVDDNTINLAILNKILENDYNIITATNGKIAMEILKQDNGKTISAVVLDLVMPIMDGFEVLKKIHSDSDLSKIPVLVASGKDYADENNAEVMALSLGANDYLTKPYKPEVIKHRIANTISLVENSKLISTALNDKITGLLSEEFFFSKSDELIKASPNNTYDLICCDIERFKLVNDLYGKEMGNALLKHVADILMKTIGKNCLIGRIGADVFAFITNHHTDYNNSDFEDLNEKVNIESINLNISVKFGICTIDDNTVPIELICDRASLARQSVKQKYGICYKLYDSDMRKKLIEDQFITMSMKSALNNGEFVVYFQPKYNIKTEKIVGAEALVRWNNPTKGFMSPGLFIPIFEKNGFITSLDIYVWEYVCKKLRAWLDMGNPAVPISVNVSRADIYNPDIVKIILSLIRKYRLSTKYICLEITESAYTENPQQLLEVVYKLKKLGFIIEMDDFGTGYSSLNMLSDLPIDVLKLDIGFMQNQQKRNSRNILSFIISLAKWLNLGVIAEGVETEEQVDFLRSLNCTNAQGYYYAKPMPQKDFENLLLEQISNENLKKINDFHKPTVIENNIYNAKNVIVLTNNEECFTQIYNSLYEEYSLYDFENSQDCVNKLRNFNSSISLVFYSFDDESINYFDKVISYCNDCSIPLIGIDVPKSYISKALTLGMYDMITTPIIKELLIARIENVICKSDVSKFEMNKEITIAIAEMKKKAEEDSLTGLLNRIEYENKVNDFFLTNDVKDGCFIMIDIDNFKSINDTYGHLSGDNALQFVAKALQTIFADTNYICRMGGDEFSVFIPFETDKEIIIDRVNQICKLEILENDNFEFSSSVGVCIAPIDGNDFKTLYEKADVALLNSKRLGKKQFCFYEKIYENHKNFNEIPSFECTRFLVENSSDAIFVSDAITSKIIFINDTACNLIKKAKEKCIGKHCYEIFWKSCKECERCVKVSNTDEYFYNEDIMLPDCNFHFHLKAKLEVWDGKRVKIHYLQKF